MWLCTCQAGGRAVVSIAGEDVMTLPLDRDAQVVLGEGDHTNTLVIRDGAAAVTQASCPDQVCVRQGRIQYQGETIVCLPTGWWSASRADRPRRRTLSPSRRESMKAKKVATYGILIALAMVFSYLESLFP